MIPFDEYGNREHPTILLLHGAAALDTFCGQYCFSERYHVIVPHLYGAGKSVDHVYDPDRMQQELFALIDSLQKEKIGVIGHSLGGQLAVMLVCARPEQFSFAIFLSAWVNPNPKTVKQYCAFAGMAARLLHVKWLVRFQARYWKYTKEQADYLVDYASRITPQIYQSFFAHTLDLQKIPAYLSVNVPMLAICGSGEVKDMKVSLAMLGKNSHCQTMILPRAGHDFPMRNRERLNAILRDFLTGRAEEKNKNTVNAQRCAQND